MQRAEFHHANAIAEEIGNQLQTHLEDRDSKMCAVLQQIPGLSETSSSSEDSQEEHAQAANSVVTHNVQLERLKLLREIQLDLKPDRRNKPTRPTRPRFDTPKAPRVRFDTPNAPRRPGYNRKTPDDKMRPWRDKISKYCWSHGACNHDGKDCEFKAPGHKEEATKENKMGGSKAYCR